MANITLRQSSGNTEPRLANVSISNTPLTNVQLDNNFNNLNNDVNSRLSKSGGEVAGNLTISGNTIINSATVSEVHTNDLDLQAVSTTLHRSPNAITAMFIYDVAKTDSDGGAWTEKCAHTSWWNEPLNGKWLGAQATESAARAVSGAATGDYFQLTTDGKFYKLNTTSGTTEVFRGNKKSFPKVAAIVAEADNVNIYDLTEPGRPMFCRFGNTSDYALTGSVSTLTALNGVLAVGSGSGVFEISFPRDTSTQRNATSYYLRNGNLANRNAVATFSDLGVAFKIANATVNALAATILPDAPLDPVTGLKVPTIAVATGGGVSVIRHDGVIANVTVSDSLVAKNIFFTKDNSIGYYGNYAQYSPRIIPIPVSSYSQGTHSSRGSATTRWYTQAASPGDLKVLGVTPGEPQALISYSKSTIAVGEALGVSLVRENNSSPKKGMMSYVTNTYNTGHLIGDIRRCFLADTATGSVTGGPELVTNGDFSNGTTGWSAYQCTLAVTSGQLVVTSTVAGNEYVAAYQTISGLTAGKSYQIKIGTIQSGIYTVYDDAIASVPLLSGATVAGSRVFIAPSDGEVTLNLFFTSSSIGQTANFDNISVKEVIPDRSYKAAGANIEGTLTAAAVASNASLVAYSGFSAANYAREPYSADLDFGTGEWSVGAWVNVPTGNAAAATIACREHSSGPYIRLGIDSTNKLTATAFDGTTTRTVTTAAAYNTATWTKARATYTTDGTLGLTVNGQPVATTTGAPLLTLNNASAVLTIGNSYALDAPFPGSISLLKFSATVPTQEQALWMYEQEKQLFREGAQCVLPSSGNVLDLAYDDETDTWSALQATHESTWSGLVRTSTQTPSAGSFAKCVAGSGNKLLARTTTNPGVDIQIPNKNLKSELSKKSETAMRLSSNLITFDYVGGFTATTSANSTSITSVSGLSYPTSYIGAVVTGSGIPASTTITNVSDTTIYLSKAATASASGVQISFTDFVLPVGYEAKTVMSAGVIKQEGSTKDWQRLYDGFKETIRFGTAPGYTTWVSIQAEKTQS